MMKTIEFYWNDLAEKKQKELLEIFGDNCNWDVIPIATMDYEDDSDDERVELEEVFHA